MPNGYIASEFFTVIVKEKMVAQNNQYRLLGLEILAPDWIFFVNDPVGRKLVLKVKIINYCDY